MRWNRTIGMTSTSSRRTATAEESGQSRLLKNSLHSVLPIIRVSDPPSRSGMTNSPTAGMKTRKQPAMMPGSDSGTVTNQNAFMGRQPRSAAASSRLRRQEEHQVGKDGVSTFQSRWSPCHKKQKINTYAIY